MADRFLSLGIKYDQPVTQAEMAKMRKDMEASLQSFNLSVNLQGVVSEAKRIADETKAVLKDLGSFREWQDDKISAEEGTRLKKRLAEDATLRKQNETAVGQELLNIQRGYWAQMATLNKTFTAEGMMAVSGKDGITWQQQGMGAGNAAAMATFYKNQSKEIEAAQTEGLKMNKAFDAAALSKWREETERVTVSHKALDNSSQSLGRTIRSLHSNFLPLVAELYVAKQAYDMTIGSVMNYLGTIETAQNGIAAGFMTGGKFIEQTTGKVLEGEDAFRAAQTQTKAVMKELQLANFETLATLDQLVVAYQTAIPIGLAKAFSPTMIKDFTLAMVQAAGAIGLPFNQMAEEIRSLLQGTINPRNTRIAVALGISNEDVRQYKGNAEGLFNFLMGKLEAYRTAGVAAQNSWAGLWANTKDISLMLGGQALGPLFEFIKQELIDAQRGVLQFDEVTGKVTGFKPEVQESIKSVTNVVEACTKGVYALREAFALVAGSASDVFWTTAKIGQVATGQLLLPESWTSRISNATGMVDYNQLVKYWETTQRNINETALDAAERFQAIDLKAQGLRKATAAELAPLEHGGVAPNIVRVPITTGAGLERGVYYTGDTALKAKYQQNPPKPDDDKIKNLFGRETASDKAILTAQLQFLKDNLALQEHELDRFHEYGRLTTVGYADAKRAALAKGLQDELETEEKMYPKIQRDIENKRDRALANDKEHKNTKAINDAASKELEAAEQQHITRVQKLKNDASKKNIDLAYNEYQSLRKIQDELQKHLEAMGGISAQGVLDKIMAQVEQQKSLNDYLYNAKKITAVDWYATQDKLDKQDTDAKNEKIRQDLENWKIGEQKKWEAAEYDEEAGTKMYYAQAEKRTEADRQVDKNNLDLQTKLLARELQRLDSVQHAYGQGGYAGAVKKSLELVSREYVDAGKNILDATKNVAAAMTNSFTDFFDYTSAGFLKFGQLATSILNEIYKETLKALIIKPLVGGITGTAAAWFDGSSATPGYSNSGAYSSFGSSYSFLPRAGGGDTEPGGTYIVGENGPERLYMGSNRGYVAPGAGSGNISISVVVNNQGQPVNVTRQEVSQVNPDEYVVNLWLQGYSKNVGGIRDAFGR